MDRIIYSISTLAIVGACSQATVETDSNPEVETSPRVDLNGGFFKENTSGNQLILYIPDIDFDVSTLTGPADTNNTTREGYFILQGTTTYADAPYDLITLAKEDGSVGTALAVGEQETFAWVGGPAPSGIPVTGTFNYFGKSVSTQEAAFRSFIEGSAVTAINFDNNYVTVEVTDIDGFYKGDFVLNPADGTFEHFSDLNKNANLGQVDGWGTLVGPEGRNVAGVITFDGQAKTTVFDGLIDIPG
jgi:hypothetical protein